MRGAGIAIVLALGLAAAGCAGGHGGASSGPTETAGPTPAWTSPSADADESQLLHGMRTDLDGTCVPLREDLPVEATAGVACAPPEQPVTRVTVYLFETQPAMLDAYARWVSDHGVTPRSHGGRCLGASSEGAYLPGDDHGWAIPQRSACKADASGRARYTVTLPPFVLAVLEGAPGADLPAVEGWAWLGNRDTQGGPTVWSGAGPLSPEK